MNSIKSVVRPMNSSKNKLNSKISWQKICYPNATLRWTSDEATLT